MMRVTFLDHSGFLAELSSAALLFDWWKGELPPLPDMTNGEGIQKLQSAIDKLQSGNNSEQISLSEITGETAEE